LGLSVGAIFTLYAPLEPSIYSLGGIFLAQFMLLIARLYHHILNTLWFFRITLFVEIALLMAIVFFLMHQYNYQTALIMYIGYQMTFIFGSYLIRAETLLLKTNTLLSKLDTSKQLGYLLGMGVSYLFYKFFPKSFTKIMCLYNMKKTKKIKGVIKNEEHLLFWVRVGRV